MRSLYAFVLKGAGTGKTQASIHNLSARAQTLCGVSIKPSSVNQCTVDAVWVG